jgi:hypothetical protein
MTMFAYFAALFFVNALVALIQWYLINHSVETQFDRMTNRFTSFVDEQLSKFDITASFSS